MARVLDQAQFLSPYGIRSLSKEHETRQDLGDIPGLGAIRISYEPGESLSGLFGGNSNWRGPIWFPLNFMLIRALDRFHSYLGDTFTVDVPGREGETVTLGKAADMLAERLTGIFRRNEEGLRPVFARESPFQDDPHWRELILFHDYFHGETGEGLGAAHPTGWTALAANMITRRYDKTSGK